MKGLRSPAAAAACPDEDDTASDNPGSAYDGYDGCMEPGMPESSGRPPPPYRPGSLSPRGRVPGDGKSERSCE